MDARVEPQWNWSTDEWLTNGMDEDELVSIMDEYIDDMAPLNRAAFRSAARRILERLRQPV